MKKIALYILLTLTPLLAWADDYYSFYSGGFYYRIQDESLSTVYVCNKDGASTDCYSGNVTVPQSVAYNNKRWTVTGVADGCFYKCTGVTGLTLPSTIVYIGSDAAEGCTALVTLTMKGDAAARGTAVRIMDKENFHYVTTLSLDRNISSASYSGLFQSVKTVVLGENVLSIPHEAFSSSSAITSITTNTLCPPVFQGDYSRNFPSSLTASSVSVTVPGGEGVKALYQKSNVWSSFTSMVTSATSLISTDADGYYQLSTADQLMFFSKKVEGGETSIKGRLQNDVSLSGVTYSPIGTLENPYKGTFDGQCHRIKNLTIASDYTDYTALFGVLGSGAVVKRIILDSSCSITGGDGSAGIVGTTASSGSGSVTIAQCGNEASIKGELYAGGIFGRNNNSSMIVNITNCYNIGTVTAPSNAGGLAGLLQTNDKIRYSYDYPTLTYYTTAELGAQTATERQFKQGYVAFKLNEPQTSVWGQDIRIDERPLLFQATTGVHYSRLGSGWSSIILPFPISSTDNVQLYAPTKVYSNAYVRCIKISSCAANTPCLYYTEQDSVDFRNTGTVISTTAETASASTDITKWTMKGACFNRQTVNASSLSATTKRYTISDGTCQLATKAAYVNPYYCWLEATETGLESQYTLTDKCFVEINITDAGWATFVTPFDITLSQNAQNANVRIYTATMADEQNSWVRLTKVENNRITAGTPVVLSGDKYTETFSSIPTVKETMVKMGCLTGNLTGALVDVDATSVNNYLLQKQGDVVGWYLVNTEGLKIGINHCYMTLGQNEDARQYIPIGFDDPTVINRINAEAQTKADGKYIVNGKIITVKEGKAYFLNGQEIR